MNLAEAGILIAQIGAPEMIKKIVETAVETHIKPMLQKHADYKDNSVYLEECLEEYLETSYNKAMSMNTIVFRGIPKTIYDLYIPLTLTTHNGIDAEEDEEYIIDDDYAECINSYNKILIIDTAGMGKSTLVKYLSIQSINHNDYIPIIIELRKADKSIELLDYILEQFELLDKKIEKKDFVKMLKRGDFIIFFDGYDEITNENRGGVLDNIQNFIKKAGKNKYVLTSRDENDLNCFGDFQRFSIKPLSVEEAFSLIRKYDNNGEKSERLIERITKDNQLDILKEFLINPMLTSLLYKTFEYKEEISYKKLGFYSQVYEALYNDHDKTKGGAYVHPKKSQLDSLDFEKLLRRIAFMSLKNNQVEYTKQAIVDVIDKCLKNMSWVKVSTLDVLDDLTHAVPLFQKDGNDYRWAHKSFMEYFAAGYICYDSGKTEIQFEKMVNSEKLDRYKNVIDFCYDMKPDIARRIILYPHICKFIKQYEAYYDADIYSKYDRALVDFRKSSMFTHEMVLVHFASSEEAEKAFRSRPQEIFASVNKGRMSTITLLRTSDLVLHNRTNNYIINEMLLNKNVDIFKSIKRVDRVAQQMDIEYGNYSISDDARLKINREQEYFEYVTKLIMRVDVRAPYLDYEKCIALKAKIESEIEEKSDMDFEL
ncbi:NACHT domain-containing protein [Enterocloster bolteae]|nr:NACHT domain-containing protein [Enterocloster bolteae]